MARDAEVYSVEIGQATSPDDVVTTRVRSADGSIGLTCPRVSGPSMAAQLMATLVSSRRYRRADEVRRYLPWPQPPERYRVIIEESSAEEVVVRIEAEDGRETQATATRRGAYRTAADLMQQMRRQAGDPAGDERSVWDAAMANMDLPRRQERPAPGAELKGGGWPEDEELPLDPDECIALIKGLGVVPRRPLSLDQLQQLPGKWEMIDARIHIYRT